uniref:Lipocalin-like domain-containing protein n=1 Tax=Prevotella sp. GTC17262 TaxID=3236797 RepID=A0AB33JJ27_9BACT
MKKCFSRYMLVALMASLFVSCEVETSDNGDLDGFWHLEQIETLSTGSVVDLSDELMFWSFQHRLMAVADRSYRNPEVVLRFKCDEKQLVVSEPYISDREKGDIKVTEVNQLAPYGIMALTDTFTIERLKGSTFVLKNKKLRLTLKRF